MLAQAKAERTQLATAPPVAKLSPTPERPRQRNTDNSSNANSLEAKVAKLFQEEDWPGAVDVLTAETNRNSSAWAPLAYALHSCGRYSEATVAWEKSDFGPIGLYGLARALSMCGETDEALNKLSEALEAGFAGFDGVTQARIESDFDAIRGEPRFAEILRSHQSKSAALPDIESVDHFARGQLNLANGNSAESIVDLSLVIRTADNDKTRARCHFLRAKAWKLQNDDQAMTADFVTSAMLSPNSYHYLIHAARALSIAKAKDGGDPALAKEFALRACDLCRYENAEALAILAIAYAANQEFEAANSFITAAIKTCRQSEKAEFVRMRKLFDRRQKYPGSSRD